MTTYFSAKELLSPPTERAAFSDRQAYICAELSKLAYFKFEGESVLEQALAAAGPIVDDTRKMAALEQRLRTLLAGAPTLGLAGKAALREILSEVQFELIATFVRDGTQAFLCTRKVELAGGTKTVAFLVFRGTEPKDFRDIKTDISASLVTIKIGGKTVECHAGYLQSFRLIEFSIQQALGQTKYDQLFITGHSLGGALAMLATVILGDAVTGACYTYGAPPIGTAALQNDLKTPIYEIINELDIVPRLPNPWWTAFLLATLQVLRIVTRTFTLFARIFVGGTWEQKIETFIKSLNRYRHPGYLSYLVGKGADARLRFNVSSFDQVQWWGAILTKRTFRAFESLGTDHFVDNYVEKLKTHALNRQSRTSETAAVGNAIPQVPSKTVDAVPAG